MSNYICRLMQEADLNEVIELVQQAGDFAWSPKNIQESVLSSNDKSFVLSAASGSKNTGIVLGYAVIHTVLDESHLLNIVIKKKAQGKGLGDYLLQQLIDFVKAQNQHLFLLEVRASNSKAIKLYENVGFKRNGIRKAYYPAETGREDAWLYSLSLV
ncbi:MAG: ribosomal-protein-alanine N-acetyltransferase [SAR86 cluster bacterium]|uniref:Ribosomal-protein-alanine N-acetyltransferase n=1 Tax=SAR86 cluster bacterium TaxID=2030880 RepID=A0A2A5C6U9_9GAMM|nr:MAG: ribosomal-protein-alanine N-acetyltransferase [SAR86 cluster bacterium]